MSFGLEIGYSSFEAKVERRGNCRTKETTRSVFKGISLIWFLSFLGDFMLWCASTST